MNPPRRRSGRVPRILFIATDLSTGGGVNKVIRDLAVLFRRALSADVMVVNARSDRRPSYTFPEDVPVQQHRQRSLLSYFVLLLRLRRSRPDFVVSSWTQDNILVALAFLLSGTKVILVEHTSWYFHCELLRLFRRVIYPFAWRVIVLNPQELRHYRKHLRNVRLLPNPIVMEEPRPSTAREKLIVAVGHLEPRKNFADAIRAMARSGLEQEGWSLAIIGEGPEYRDLETLIRELSLKRTSIHPPTPDLGSWYARSSLTLVTARLEVFSLVLAEAMLFGALPIAYATDGPSFILENFPQQLVPIGNVELLAERLAHFARLEDAESLRAELRTSIETRFSPAVIADQWKELLDS